MVIVADAVAVHMNMNLNATVGVIRDGSIASAGMRWVNLTVSLTARPTTGTPRDHAHGGFTFSCTAKIMGSATITLTSTGFGGRSWGSRSVLGAGRVAGAIGAHVDGGAVGCRRKGRGRAGQDVPEDPE